MNENTLAHLSSRQPADRRTSRELGRIEQRTGSAEAMVVGVNQVAQRAMFETMMTGLVRREAERIAPDQAEIYAMISLAAGMATVNVINAMTRGR